MTTRELVSVAIKVFAIYILVQVLVLMPSMVSTLAYATDLNQNSTPWIALGGIGAIVASAVIAFFAWRLSTDVVSGALPGDVNTTETPRHAADWESFVLSVLGLYLMVRTIVVLVPRATGTFVQVSDANNPHGVDASTIAMLVCLLLQGLLGLSLVIRAKGWAALLRRLRGLGLQAQAQGPDHEKDATRS